MELDDLKTQWLDLDKRLESVEAKIELLTAQVASGKFTSAKQRLMRMYQLGIAMILLLPAPLMAAFRLTGNDPQTAFYVVFGLFFLAMLARDIVMLVMLSRIDPARQSVREACAATLRFRRSYLTGVAVGAALAVPTVVLIGIYMAQMTMPSILYGFVGGFFGGLIVGWRVYKRMMGEINALQTALEGTQE